MEERLPLPAGKWSKIVQLPVPNLIQMLKNIVAETNQNMEKRERPPKSRYAATGDREKLSSILKELARYDILSASQFDDLMTALEPDDVPRENEGAGFDISPLYIAANLYSLLPPPRRHKANE